MHISRKTLPTDAWALPETVKVEVKFTTGSSISLPAREFVALKPGSDRELGLVASLFWPDDKSGSWILVPSHAPAFGPASGWPRRKLQAMARECKAPEHLEQHVERFWQSFLVKNREVAALGHRALCESLAVESQQEVLLEGARKEVLRSEFADSMSCLLEQHGEKYLGIIMQDLLGYLLVALGYRLQNNPIGVPDLLLTSVLSAKAHPSGSSTCAE